MQAEATISTTTPIVVIEKKKKKRKYSRGPLRALQELEKGLSSSARKLADAVQKGIEEYEDARDKSSTNKKDGALRDMLRNQSKALRIALPIAAEAPSDLLDSIADMKVVRDVTEKKRC
ncbi:MAG: hypothetical protein JWM99_2829 [Verrucomicrobiales bacterium]|nr:hypothetical protein [Verrucomicrobiales bacterium]